MSINVVQDNTGNNGFGPAGTTVTVTLPSGTTAGNCLVVAVGATEESASLPTVSSVKLGTVNLAKAAGAGNSSADSSDCEWWVLPNIAAGQTTVTVTVSATSFITATAYEVSGVVLSSPVDQTQSNSSGTTGSDWTSNSTAGTSQANEIWFGAVAAWSNGAYTGPDGWNNNLQGPTEILLTGYQVVSTTGTAEYSGSQSGDTDNVGWAAAVITLKGLPPPPFITTTNVPGGAAGEAYSFTFGASGGTPGYSWAVTSGSLPPGLTLSSAGVASGTPTTAGVYSFTVTVTDAATRTASGSFQIVVNANSTPGGTVRATWAMAAGAYTYGTLTIPVSTAAHNWVFVALSWMSSEDTGIAYVADSAHNLYQPGPLASGTVNTQLFIVPNARAISEIYVSTSAFAWWLNVQITEVTGLQPGYVIDASSTFTAGSATSLPESLTTANADFILAVGALTGAPPQTITQAGTGASWTALTGSFNGSSSAGITQSLAWAETTGSASPAMTFSGASGAWSGVMVAVRSAGGLPVNPNPAWPVISCQAAFGYTPQQPTVHPTWTDITSRFLGINGQRGRSFELDEIAAADVTVSLDNFDGALSPQNTSSPYYPNVTPITPVRVVATWQGRNYVLFRGLITAIPLTFDFQRGMVEVASSDDFSKLPQILLATCFIQEMLYDEPLDLWPLNDQQGAPYASNWSGRSGAQLVPTVAQAGTPAGGTAPPAVLTVTLFGKTFPVSSSFLTTASSGSASTTGTSTASTSNTPATGFGNSQGGSYPGGFASTTDTVWGNTATRSGSTFQSTVLVDSNDSLPLTATGATYAAWAQMYSSGTSLNGSTGAMIMCLNAQAGSGTAKYLAVYYNGTTVTVSQTSGSHTFTPSGPSLFDGEWHLWAVTIGTGSVVTLYLDGVSLGSYTATFPAGTPAMLQFGGDSTVSATSAAGLFTGCMTNAAVYDRVIDAARIQTWFLSGSTGFLDELAGVRIQRILAWARWSAPQCIDPGLSEQQAFNYLTGGYGSSGLTGAIGNFQTAGGSAAVDTGAQADMTVQDIANTENGLLLMTAGGELIFRNRNRLSSFPGGLALGDMDYALNQTVAFSGGLGEWTTAANCTVARSNAWSYMDSGAGLMTVTGTPSAASVTGAQWPIQGTQAGFSAWVMSPQGCFAQLSVNWYGQTYADVYQASYTDSYGLAGGYGLISTTNGVLTWCPPMTPVFLMFPATAAPGGATNAQGVITIGSSPATGTQLYFDRTRLSPAGFQVPYKNNDPGDLQITEDIQYLYNDIAVTRNVDQAAYRVINAASRSRYYPRIYTRTIFSSQDDPNALLNCATTLLNAFQNTQLRVERVIIDAAENPEAWPFVLGTDIGDLVQFTHTPVGGAAVTGSFLILSIEPEIAPDKAQFTYALVPAGVF